MERGCGGSGTGNRGLEWRGGGVGRRGRGRGNGTPFNGGSSGTGFRGRGRGFRPNGQAGRGLPGRSTGSTRCDFDNDGSANQDGRIANTNAFILTEQPRNSPSASADADAKLGFRQLYKFLEQLPDKVILTLHLYLKEWEELLGMDELACEKSFKGRSELNDDRLVLVIYIIGEKLCFDTTLTSIQLKLLTTTINNRNFITKLEQKCQRLCFRNQTEAKIGESNENGIHPDQSPTRILKSIHQFLQIAALKFPTTSSERLSNVISTALQSIRILLMMNSEDVSQEELNELKEKFEELTAAQKSKEELHGKATEFNARLRRNELSLEDEDEADSLIPPQDFRTIPVVPDMNELLCTDQPFLRPNKIGGTYRDADHYLDVQFRLFREDFVRPLRKGVQEFLRHKNEYASGRRRLPIGDVRLYRNVMLQDVRLMNGTVVHSIRLPEYVYKKIKWDRSKKFLAGSLLLLSQDSFKSVNLAVVFRRDEDLLRRHGILHITWEGEHRNFDRSLELVMMESEVYFEAYRHTLETLKIIKLNEFPMAKYIVEASSAAKHPEYLQGDKKIMLGTKAISPLVADDWPTPDSLKLDQMQFNAFKAALTEEMVCIQGPPGTGKTYLGLQIFETLLKNRNVWKKSESDGPILVVCYTNHALDQFLEGCLDIFKRVQRVGRNIKPKMIRVGGRCSNRNVEEFSIHKQRFDSVLWHDSQYRSMKYQAVEKRNHYEEKRAKLLSELAGLQDLRGIPNFVSLTIKNQMEATVSRELWMQLKKIDWYGLHLVSDVSDAAKLRRMFPFNDNQIAALDSPVIGHFNNFQVASPIPVGRALVDSEKDESDEEYYDVEELQANRLVEDVLAEVESFKLSEDSVKLKYSFQSFPRDLDIGTLKYRLSILELPHDPKKPPSREGVADQKRQIDYHKDQLYLLGEMKREWMVENENRSRLFMKIHRAFKLGFIEAIRDPNVLTSYSEQQNEYMKRWGIFFGLVEMAKDRCAREMVTVNEELIKASKEYQEVVRYGDGELLKDSVLVGMTTTGAAKFNDLLRMMNSKIVIVEEAAEVLESHIVTCITAACEHLILIGDHKQLRPSTKVFELAKRYHLDISLFERMLENNLKCYRINAQHRMRPEISNLLVGTIYDELEDHESVKHYPDVVGVEKNLYFLSHEVAEKSDTESKSKSNPHEAEFLAEFCRYLVLQGYTPSRITILATYTGQMFLLKKEVYKFPCCKGVRITVVDNFQGEENDIILLSLVRSNEEENVGFLKTDNRICVAISRAKQGMFMIGNIKNLTAHSETWKKIEQKLKERENIGTELPLKCQIHGTCIMVSSCSDFQNCPEGGCNAPCGRLLQCGHKCGRICHPEDREHTEYKCPLPCEKQCKNGHQCQSACYMTCRPCPTIMLKTLPCQHEKQLSCHVDEESYECEEIVLKSLPCGHEEYLPCFIKPADYKCQMQIDKDLPCGHTKRDKCYIDPADITCKIYVRKMLPCGHEEQDQCFKHADQIKCTTKVEKVFSDCGHKMMVECKDLNKPRSCMVSCDARLDCGHSCDKPCHVGDNPNHFEVKCTKNCNKKCEADSSHRCKGGHKCFEPCPPCRIITKKVLRCQHEKDVPCNLDQNAVICRQSCQRTLYCGHKCNNLCFQLCGPCNELVNKMSDDCGHIQNVKCSEMYTRELCEYKVSPLQPSLCGHDVRVPCKISGTLDSESIMAYCDQPCGHFFNENEGGCGHFCAGSCSECSQGRFHKKCMNPCGKVLICGHVCDSPCSTTCPPCGKKCNMKCPHSQCKKPCGVPCSDCSEKCKNNCSHRSCGKICREFCSREPCNEACTKKLKCGHDCIGFCGEPCPTQCRVCDKEELTGLVLSGLEDDEDARFIFLEDCKHAIEVTAMNSWMKLSDGNGEVKVKRCPKCNTVIQHSVHYGNILKSYMSDVGKIKFKVFGSPTKLKMDIKDLMERITANQGWNNDFLFLKEFLVSFATQNSKKQWVPSPIQAKQLHSQSLQSLEVIAKYGEAAIEWTRDCDETLTEDLASNLLQRYEKLFGSLITRKLPLNRVELQDFDREFQRLYDLKQLYLRRSNPRFSDGHMALPDYLRILNVLIGPKIYTTELKEQVYALTRDLDEKLRSGLGISERERIEIVKALDMAAGRWYKCPNGHFYVIADCGGANQEARCGECNARIGGMNHAVRSDNRFAPEVDGATAPLWPQPQLQH